MKIKDNKEPRGKPKLKSFRAWIQDHQEKPSSRTEASLETTRLEKTQ